jgi:hypothetical protein
MDRGIVGDTWSKCGRRGMTPVELDGRSERRGSRDTCRTSYERRYMSSALERPRKRRFLKQQLRAV